MARVRHLLTPITPGAKRAVAVVFLVTLALTGANLMFTAHEVSSDSAHWHQALNDTQHKFCGVVSAITVTPVKKPANPKATPAQASQYEWYERFARLGQDLGC